MWLNQKPVPRETAKPSRVRRYRPVRLNLPPTHVPLFHVWRP